MIESYRTEMDMCKKREDEMVSQNDNYELRVELPLELVSRLAQQAAASGMTLEQLVAQEVRKLAE